MAKKIYDYKVDETTNSFSIWDRQQRKWLKVPNYCTYYATIPCTWDWHNQSTVCKVSRLDKAHNAAARFITEELHGQTGAKGFWKFPFRRNK